jgi:hypothetical protein
VIDSDATTIGPEHVLDQGISDAIAIVESELMTLGRTVAASAPMLQTITRLGAGLNAFNANAAPIAMPSGTRYLPDVPIEQLSPVMPEQTLAPAASRSDGYDRSKPTATLDRAAPLPSQSKPRTEGSLPPPQQVSRREAVTTPQQGPPLTRPVAAQPTGSAMAPTMLSSASPLPSRPRSAAVPVEPPSSSLTPVEPSSGYPTPVVALSIAPGIPEVVQSRQPEVGAPPPARASIVAMTDGVGAAAPTEPRMQQVVIGAIAPNDAPQAATDMPAAQGAGPPDTPSAHTILGTPMTPRTTTDPTVQPEGAQSALAEPPRAESGSRQGMIILDGAHLGRWMMDHLERHASRPGAMTTGFDPRMSAAYPGAATGA